MFDLYDSAIAPRVGAVVPGASFAEAILVFVVIIVVVDVSVVEITLVLVILVIFMLDFEGRQLIFAGNF